MTRPFQIVRYSFADDTSKVLASYASYDAADEALDAWCNRFPHAYIDIEERND